MSKHVILFGTSQFKKFIPEFKELLKELGIKSITADHKNGLVAFNYNGDEFLVRGFYGSGVYNSKAFKGASKIFLLGMCYGFKGINKGDYCLPNSFSLIERMPLNYRLTYKFKKSDVSKPIIINNVFNEFIKGVNVKTGIRVVTNAWGFYTPQNVSNLDFDAGEMESYLVADVARRMKTPFGSLLVCTDNEEHNAVISILWDCIGTVNKVKLNHEVLNKMRLIIGAGNNAESLYKKLSEDELDELLNLYVKCKNIKEVIKYRNEQKEKEPNIFQTTVTNHLFPFCARLIKNVKTI